MRVNFVLFEETEKLKGTWEWGPSLMDRFVSIYFKDDIETSLSSFDVKLEDLHHFVLAQLGPSKPRNVRIKPRTEIGR